MNKHWKMSVAAVAGAAALIAGPAAANAATTGHETFVINLRGSGNDPGTVKASGVFSGRGTDVEVSNTEAQFIFPGKGTIFLTHHDKGKGSDHLNPHTCVDTFRQTGTVAITGGKAQFKGASGSGTFALSGTFTSVKKPNGKCDRHNGTVDVTITVDTTLTLVR